MLNKIATFCAGVLTLCAATMASAEEKETWKGPFGGTFSAGMTIASDYSYRGISQTQRSFAFQPTFLEQAHLERLVVVLRRTGPMAVGALLAQTGGATPAARRALAWLFKFGVVEIG